MTEEIIITEKYFDNHEDDFQDFTYYTVREGMHIHLYDAIKKQNEYVQRLEQENKELKEKIRIYYRDNSNLLAERNAAQIGYDEIREVRERYRSALEEIKITVKQLLKGVFSNCINNTPYLTALSLIENKIDEVLNG